MSWEEYSQCSGLTWGSSCVTLGKFLSLSEPQASRLIEAKISLSALGLVNCKIIIHKCEVFVYLSLVWGFIDVLSLFYT